MMFVEAETPDSDKPRRRDRARSFYKLLKDLIPAMTLFLIPGASGGESRLLNLMCWAFAYGTVYADILAILIVLPGALLALFASARWSPDDWSADIWLDVGVSLIIIAVFQLTLQRLMLRDKRRARLVKYTLTLFVPVALILLAVSILILERTSWWSQFCVQLSIGLLLLAIVDTFVVGGAVALSDDLTKHSGQ